MNKGKNGEMNDMDNSIILFCLVTVYGNEMNNYFIFFGS